MLPRVRAWAVFALLLGTLTYAMAEDITLTTYYPSPRGVYKELRTTGNTLLAIDEGSVGIGTDGPNPDVKLDVAGGMKLGNIAPTAFPQPGMVKWTGTNFEGRNATEWVRFMSMPEGSNAQMAYASGANPPCPAGSGIPLMRKWASKTCGSSSGIPNIPSDCETGCTTTAGWNAGPPPTCGYTNPGEPCGQFTCTADSWTEEICMGN